MSSQKLTHPNFNATVTCLKYIVGTVPPCQNYGSYVKVSTPSQLAKCYNIHIQVYTVHLSLPSKQLNTQLETAIRSPHNVINDQVGS